VKISIVVPCRNEKRHIGAFLDSLLRQRFDRDWEIEILVADGMSDDGTREILRQYMLKAPSVQMIDNPGCIVSTGLNAAIAASTGEIIIRMDAHTVYARDYVRQCVSVLRETGADNVGGPWIARGIGHMGRAIAAAFQSPFCAGGGKSHDPNYEGDADTVYLGCWRRSAFERFGLFDPELVRNQDDELNFRIRRAGGRLFQSPRIQSYYTPRSSLFALFKQYLQYGFWKVAVMRKHGSVASWRHLVPALFVSSITLGLLLIALSAALGWSTLALLAGTLLGVELTFYALACLTASLPYVGTLELPALLAVPGVIAVHHISYGLGFLMGLLQRTPSGTNSPQPAKFFTALTR
jgi:succinoglycan biosynthesis protein ExoA